MLKAIAPLTFRIDGIEVTLKGYGFRQEGDRFVLIEDNIDQAIDIDFLPSCYVALLARAAIIRCGAVDTVDKAFQLLQVIRKLHDYLKESTHSPNKPLRTVLIQLSAPEINWDGISRQHQAVVNVDSTIDPSDELIHLNMPMEHYFQQVKLDPWMASTIRNLRKLTCLQNMEAWASYGYWLNAEIEVALNAFLPTAVDEYQLEARFKDFAHEVHSPLLVTYRKTAAELNRKMADVNNAIQQAGKSDAQTIHEITQLAKELIKAQQQIKGYIQVKYELLTQMIVGIEAIESAHPELKDLKYKILLLKRLWGIQLEKEEDSSWDSGIETMYLALLNEQLGVIEVINCESGLERTSLAFAIHLAILEIRQRSSIDRVVDMVINWDKTVKMLNKAFAAGSSEDAQNEEEGVWKKRAALVMKFRHCVLFNLRKLSAKITDAAKESRSEQNLSASEERISYLNFLPPYYEIVDEEGQKEIVKIYKIDPLSGEPQELTSHGLQLMKMIAD